MKKIFYTISFLLLLPASIWAQSSGTGTIPDNVLKEQSDKYPEAEELKWHASPDGFHVRFKQGGEDWSIIYDAEAVEKEVNRGVIYADLPLAAEEAIDSICPDYKIEGITFEYRKDPRHYIQPFLQHTSENYKVFLLKGKESYMLYFSTDGKLLNTPEKKTIRD